tara:strand:+ start:3035 stop:3418 length:384 start_codon:yes stop_codon:yes gene_type:complete
MSPITKILNISNLKISLLIIVVLLGVLLALNTLNVFPSVFQEISILKKEPTGDDTAVVGASLEQEESPVSEQDKETCETNACGSKKPAVVLNSISAFDPVGGDFSTISSNKPVEEKGLLDKLNDALN